MDNHIDVCDSIYSHRLHHIIPFHQLCPSLVSGPVVALSGSQPIITSVVFLPHMKFDKVVEVIKIYNYCPPLKREEGELEIPYQSML